MSGGTYRAMAGGAARRPRRARTKLLDRVDLLEDLLGADFLGVGRHHGIGELLHLGAVGEGNALELAGLLERLEFRAVLRGLDLPSISAGFLAGLDDRSLEVSRELLEGLRRETNRPDRDRVLGHRKVRADFIELHRLDARGFVLASTDHVVLD